MTGRPPTYLEHLDRQACRWLHRARVALHAGQLALGLELMQLALDPLESIADHYAGGAA